MRNKSLGIVLLITSIVVMIGYFWLLFLVPDDVIFLGKQANEWAIIIPVIVIVYAVLIVIAWIGWALSSTAPPLPLNNENQEN